MLNLYKCWIIIINFTHYFSLVCGDEGFVFIIDELLNALNFYESSLFYIILWYLICIVLGLVFFLTYSFLTVKIYFYEFTMSDKLFPIV